MSEISILDLVQLGLGTGVLMWVVIAFSRKKLYSDGAVAELLLEKDKQIQLKDQQCALLSKSNDEWKSIALRNVGLAQEAVKVAAS